MIPGCLGKLDLRYLKDLRYWRGVNISSEEEILDQLPVVEGESPFSTDEAANNFSVLFSSEVLAIAVVNETGNILFWNRGAERLFGYSLTEVEGEPFSCFFSEDDREKVSDSFRTVSETDIQIIESSNFEYTGVRKDETVFPVQVVYNNVFQKGTRQHLLVLYNLSDQRRTDSALLKSETFFRLVYDHSEDIMILCREDKSIVWSNTVWYRGMGYEPGEQQTLFDRVHEDDADRVARAWSGMLRGKRRFNNMVYRYRCADGLYASLETTVQNLPEQAYFYVRSHIITERKRLEETVALRTKYLELTLAVGTLLADLVDPAEVAQSIQQKMNFASTFLLLFTREREGGAQILALFKKYGKPKIVKVNTLRRWISKLDKTEPLGRFIASIAESKSGGTVLITPLYGAQNELLGNLLLAKWADQGFSSEEVGMIQILTNTMCLEIERQHYLEELKLRADLDKERADFSDRLLICRTEEEVHELTLDFFEKGYGIRNGMILVRRDGKFVFAKIRWKKKKSEGDYTSLIRRVAFLASDSSNPLVVFFHDAKAKMKYFERVAQVFEDVRFTEPHPELIKFISKIKSRIPLKRGERIAAVKIPEVGLLCGTEKGDRIKIDPRSRELVVNTVSAIIKEIRLEETREKVRRRNEIFHTLDMDLYKIPMGKIKKKLHTISAQLARFINADKILIFMPDPKDQHQLSVVSSHGRLRKAQIEVTQNAVHHVYETGDEICVPTPDASSSEPIARPEVQFDKEAQRKIEELYNAFLCAPIKGDFRRKREILGVIAISTADMTSNEDRYMIYDFINLLSGQIKDELLYEREREFATKDELTGLNNRRFFLGRAEELLKMSKRYGKKFSVVMMDIDFFKDVNDSYGHEAGDRVLQALAEVFRGLIREVDVLGRYGGEEFILLLPETDMEGAVNIAERIRKTVERLVVPFEGHTIRFTISCGVASYGENSRYLQGVAYQVLLEGGSVRISVDDRRLASIKLKLTELEDEEGSSLKALFKKDPDAEEKRNHVKGLLKKLDSLDGLISIADGRLYKSKVMGRNRVTHGPW